MDLRPQTPFHTALRSIVAYLDGRDAEYGTVADRLHASLEIEDDPTFGAFVAGVIDGLTPHASAASLGLLDE